MKILPFLRRFLAHSQGVALIEMVIVLPFLLFLMFGGIELARYALIVMKVDKAAYELTGLVSQESPASLSYEDCDLVQGGTNEDQARAALSQFSRIMSPVDASSRQMAIVSYVKKQGGRMVVKWQVSGGGSLNTDVTSEVSGGAAQGTCCRDMTAGFSGDAATQLAAAPENEYLLVGEVFYRYQPIMRPLLQGLAGVGLLPGTLFSLSDRTITRRAYLRPRYGELEYLPDSYPVPTPTLPATCL